MEWTLEEALEVLERTPATLDALLRGSSPAWHRTDEGPGTWSPHGVVGHLVHADETNWVPRARAVLEGGDALPFEPFDRFGQLSRYGDAPLEALLDRFAEVRRASLATVRGWELGEEDLSRRGLHPELGAVTLRQLLSTWTVHDLTHVSQIVRVMARRYEDAVGPWREYLSILKE